MSEYAPTGVKTMQLYHDKDADLKVLDGKKVAVLGYGSQGRAQALCFNDSGIDVTIGVRKDGKSWNKAKEDGLKVAEFAKDADVVMMLLPDEVQPDIYKEYVEPNLKKGAALEFAHGFAITYRLIQPPADVDVIMMAPKAPGDMERLVFTEGFGVPALICIHQDVTGNAKKIALALAKGLGSTRAGVFETTFDNETYTDLFGEQSVLCGGLTALIRQGFKTLTDAGYPPEMAYFEVLHETKLIDDLIIKGGFELMWNVVSNTAEYGGMTRRDRVITEQSAEGMKSILEEIENGKPDSSTSRRWKRTRRSCSSRSPERRSASSSRGRTETLQAGWRDEQDDRQDEKRGLPRGPGRVGHLKRHLALTPSQHGHQHAGRDDLLRMPPLRDPAQGGAHHAARGRGHRILARPRRILHFLRADPSERRGREAGRTLPGHQDRQDGRRLLRTGSRRRQAEAHAGPALLIY